MVGLNSDRSIKMLKGASRPVFSQEDRSFMLESCKYVDEVIVFDEETPYNLIKRLAPDIVVKGGDYKEEEVVGNDLTQVKIFCYMEGYSTTQIFKRNRQ